MPSDKPRSHIWLLDCINASPADKLKPAMFDGYLASLIAVQCVKDSVKSLWVLLRTHTATRENTLRDHLDLGKVTYTCISGNMRAAIIDYLLPNSVHFTSSYYYMDADSEISTPTGLDKNGRFSPLSREEVLALKRGSRKRPVSSLPKPPPGYVKKLKNVPIVDSPPATDGKEEIPITVAVEEVRTRPEVWYFHSLHELNSILDFISRKYTTRVFRLGSDKLDSYNFGQDVCVFNLTLDTKYLSMTELHSLFNRYSFTLRRENINYQFNFNVVIVHALVSFDRFYPVYVEKYVDRTCGFRPIARLIDNDVEWKTGDMSKDNNGPIDLNKYDL